MKKTKKIQANYRLPESLLQELKEVATATDQPQSAIVYDALREKLADLGDKCVSVEAVKHSRAESAK